MIANAHLDPVWMWSWYDGVDETIATCRTACDLLDEYPELQITRGEAWVYYQIHRIAPKLFKRIAAHIQAGRWHVVNGWWVQPDCNLPMAESFLKHSEIGGRFLKEHLGVEATVGYNVDSFGHCAMLPTFLRQGGKDAYVYTRPGAHEMHLPANLFRWRSPAGDEVLAFHAASYAGGGQMMTGCLEREIARVSPGVGHTVCMYGTGDHGGGPTRETIDWIRQHRQYTENVELRFSNLRAFFDAVTPLYDQLPVYEGELQNHAIGCYAVVRDLKRECRRAETLLLQAEYLADAKEKRRDRAVEERFDEAWRTVLFNQFHDILCGSSIVPACGDALDELGGVKHFARDFLVRTIRQRNQQLPACPRQRVVVDNPGPRPWHGYVEYEPWLWTVGDSQSKFFTLLDETGACVSTQALIPGAASDQMRRILFPVNLPPGGRQIFELRRLPAPRPVGATGIRVAGQSLENGRLSAECGARGVERITRDGADLLDTAGIRLVIVEDGTDTWSHGINSFDGPVVDEFIAGEPWAALEDGPLRGELVNDFTAEDGSLRWSVSLTDGGAVLRLRLRLHWHGRDKHVRLRIPPAFPVSIRRDGTPGTVLQRPLDGKEYPVMDILSLAGPEQCLTIVSPDLYSASVTPEGVAQLTLLRSPLYAYEGGSHLPPHNAYQATDQGVHEFDIAIMATATFEEESALNEAYRLNAPPLLSETTLGMPPTVEGSLPDDVWLPGELLALAEEPDRLSIVPGAELCRQWQSERLLVSPGHLRLKLPVPEPVTCRLSMAVLAGGDCGTLELVADGRVLGSIPGTGKRSMPHLVEFKVTPSPGRDMIELDVRRVGGNLTAIGFVRLLPSYQDIRAAAWKVAGPFSPEQDFREGGEPQWQPLQGNDDYIDFHAYSRTLMGSVHYAVAHLASSRPQTARLLFGMDYWISIWVNGKAVVECMHPQGVPSKGQFQVEVPFEQGTNEIMVKLASGSTGNGFWMAVPDDGSLEILPIPSTSG
jgi:alpha-mannosidase